VNQTKFIDEVLGQLPGFSNTGTFFYVTPFDHVLTGFGLEITAKGAFLIRFVYPLFFKFECLTLTYSDRFKGLDGYLDFKEIEEKSLPVEFISRIKERMGEAKNCLTIQQFCTHVLGNRALQEISHVQMVLGYAYILAGDKQAALEWLTRSVKNLSDRYRAECLSIMKLLNQDLFLAEKKIRDFEQEMKKILGIT